MSTCHHGVAHDAPCERCNVSDRFTLIGYPTLVFRVVRRYSIGSGRNAIYCIVGRSDDGRRTVARVDDVIFGGARA